MSLFILHGPGKTVDNNPEVRMDGAGIEDLGKPRLGDIVKLTVTIQESTEFKVCVCSFL